MKLPRTFDSKLTLESLPYDKNNDKYGEAHTIRAVASRDVEIDQIEFPTQITSENQAVTHH